jgi:uncharacterized membrane protein
VDGGEILWLFYIKKIESGQQKKVEVEIKKSFCDAAAQPLEYELFQKICRSILADTLLFLIRISFIIPFNFLLLLFMIFFFISIFFSLLLDLSGRLCYPKT